MYKEKFQTRIIYILSIQNKITETLIPMKLEEYTKEQIIFSVKSCFEHIIWDMINEGGVPDKTGNEFFENFKKALTYLEIDCTAIENLNKSNVLQYDEKIFNLYNSFRKKYRDIQTFKNCDILGLLNTD